MHLLIFFGDRTKLCKNVNKMTLFSNCLQCLERKWHVYVIERWSNKLAKLEHNLACFSHVTGGIPQAIYLEFLLN